MIDCHTHTHNSPDAKDTVQENCEQAIKLNLQALAITEHCEVNKYYNIEYYNAEPNEYDTYDFNIDFEKSMIENTDLKNNYKNRLNLISGIELGQATFDFKLSEEIISDERLDFVICSIHQLPSKDDFAFIDYSKYSITELMQGYFDEIYKLCRWGKFDILGHLTYTLRYMEGNHGLKVDLKPYQEVIIESFKELIIKNKGIEINTSGLRQVYGKTFPTLEYIKLFKDLGGEILSIGSDSHTYLDLAKGINDGIELAKEAGFNKITYFKNRKPYFIKI